MNLVMMTREEHDQALAHHGVKGQKHGLRQYQNEDGSLTPLGRIHYGIGLGRDRSPYHGKNGIILGKKQVNSDGSLTKNGVKAIEEHTKDSSYLNPSSKERKKGITKERDKISDQFSKEYWEMVGGEGKSAENATHEKHKELWDKFKDQYAEATLKDLGFPVNEKNKGVVKDAFKRYDRDYEVVDESDKETHDKEIKENRDKRFSKDLEEKSAKEIQKDVENKINEFNEKTQASKEERAAKAAESKAKLNKELSEIRTLADEELNKRINRLQREKQYAELLNERANREKGPVYETVSKLFKDAGMKLAQKALDRTGDELLKKAFSRWNENKNTDNSGNNQPNNNPKPQNQPNNQSNNAPKPQQNSPSGGNSQKFSKGEKSQIRSMAGSGKSIADIAKALGTTEDRVKNYMSDAGITIS